MCFQKPYKIVSSPSPLVPALCLSTDSPTPEPTTIIPSPPLLGSSQPASSSTTTIVSPFTLPESSPFDIPLPALPEPSQHGQSPVLASLTSAPPPPPTDLDLSIAIRKGSCQCTQHPINNHVSSIHLSSPNHAFTLSVLSGSIPKTYLEALPVPKWKATMDAEYAAFLQ